MNYTTTCQDCHVILRSTPGGWVADEEGPCPMGMGTHQPE